MPDGARPTIVDTLGPPPSSEMPQGACLIMIYGDDIGRRILLPPDRTFATGRDADCGLVLDDETVSRRHAEISRRGGRFVVRDLGSTNGTYVNDLIVEEHVLQDRDQLKIGRNIFKFLQGGNLEANYHEVIYQLMTNDGLTQAFNRRYFEQQLAREVSRAARYQRPLALLLIDVDHFKDINDQSGHLAGDEVLRQLSRLVGSNIRGEDLFARVGGEEFAVLVPEGTLGGAGQFAERLRVLIEQTPFRYEGKDHRITCSFGVAHVSPVRDTRPAELYEQADRALYRAKAAGRNCVEPAS